MDPFIAASLVSAATSAGQAVAQGGPRRQYKWNKRAAQDANTMNRDNQTWLLQQQKILQDEQRAYDAPQQQMERYKKAGLNPHLIYGNGSSAGQAFPIDAGQIAPARIDAPDASYPDIAGNFLRAGQSLATMGLNNSRIEESQARTALTEMQTEIAKTNPMLDSRVAKSVIDSTLAVAHLKEVEANQWSKSRQTMEWNKTAFDDAEATITISSRIADKIEAEVQAMQQRIGLNTADLEIKNKILQSKEFENAVKEIQAKWLKDAEITPEHIRQGLMLLLTKMLGR